MLNPNPSRPVSHPPQAIRNITQYSTSNILKFAESEYISAIVVVIVGHIFTIF